MKNSIFALAFSGLICIASCKQDTNESTTDIAVDSTKKEVWAEVVESKTILVKPEGWDEEYWKSVNKNMDSHQLFATITDAVLSGRKKAYDIFTDSLLTVDELKALVTTQKDTTANANPQEQKIGSQDLSMLRMREKWVFDKEKFRLEKRVTRIDLIYKKLDENGDYIGDKPLFYVHLD